MTFLPDPPAPDAAELSFHGLVDEAVAVTVAASQLAGRASLRLRTLSDAELHPWKTLSELEFLGRVHFGAGMVLLAERWLAYAADVHLRPMLEVYAHAGWVRESYVRYPGTTPRGRALCIELRQAQQALRQWRDRKEPTLVDLGQQILKAIQEIHAEEPCTCGGHGRGDSEVPRQLQRMAGAGAPTWLLRAWQSSSRVVHVSDTERIKRRVAEGVVVGPATNLQRATSFQLLTELYSSVLAWTIGATFEKETRALVFRLGEVRATEPLPTWLGVATPPADA